jgi:hypothetical protein
MIEIDPWVAKKEIYNDEIKLILISGFWKGIFAFHVEIGLVSGFYQNLVI